MSTTSTASSSAVDRSLPGELRDLARLAVTSGLAEVNLLFQGLGADFPAPIGWQLSLTRVDPSVLMGRALEGREDLRGGLDDPYDEERERKLEVVRREAFAGNDLWVTAQVGSGVSAFRGMDEHRWGPAEIREWILAGVSKDVVFSADDRAQLERDADWMVDAWARGWSVERSLDVGMSLIEERRLGRRGPLHVSYTFSALNHFFNVEGHPEHRSNGTEVSFDIRMTRAGVTGPWMYVSDGVVEGPQGGFTPRQMSSSDALEKIAGMPPWHAEVAYFKDEDDGWVL